MSLQIVGNTVHLQGECRVEDAEPLLRHLQADSSRIVDVSGAAMLHTAVVQVILALRPPVSGSSNDPFLRDWVLPLLNATQAGIAADAFQKGLD